MIPRYLVSAILGALITFGLFYVMQELIAQAEARPEKGENVGRIEFVRLKQEEAVQPKERKMPDKTPPEEPPPPPPMSLSKSTNPDASDAGILESFSLDAEVDMGGGPEIGGAVDTDTIPLVRIQPTYPTRAQERGIEGWVEIEFTISPRGTVEKPHVLRYEPSSIFNNSALRAIRKWKYNPKIENGKPVARPGIRVRLDFRLPKAGGDKKAS